MAIIDEKTEKEIYAHIDEKEKIKKKNGPSLISKIIVADAVMDALDKNKEKDNKKK
ncbi:MAG: hypothetical protein K6D97_00825 [Clostridia bacterium]|nr:hypothetical protein [Clostridia bacterium]